MNSYARSLPYLGFDPAPGDVDLTRDLARRHAMVAQEAQAVAAQVERLDLSAMQGKAGDALRALQATFPPALRNTASAVEGVHAAVSSWANQLSEFQAEADALERQAANASAQHQVLVARQATLPPGSVVLTADVESAASAMTGIQGQAQDLHQRYLAAASKTAAAADAHMSLWGRTEPVRKVLEFVLAPLDIVAADHWVDALKEIAGVREDWLGELDKQIKVIQRLRAAGKPAVGELKEAANLTESTGTKLDAWDTFAPNWLRTAAGNLAEIKGLSYTLTGLGVLADAGTILSPQDTGVLGGADRVTAAVNGVLLTLNATTDWVPGVGDVIIAVTGAYLAGDFLYHHFTPFHDVADDVGHATVKTADEMGHEARSAWHSVASTIGSWF